MTFLANVIEWASEAKDRYEQGAMLLKAGFKAYDDVKSGKFVSALESVKNNFPEALPIIESVANKIFPGAGNAIEFATFLLAFSHTMTPDEERRWFDNVTGDVSNA